MINIIRKYDHQNILDDEKKKNSGTYRHPDIIDSLSKDFFEKCYLCEDKDFTKINIDHFIPHKGDINKKFNYKNLFWCCAHCNGIKASSEQKLLNPTIDEIEDKFNYSISFSKEGEFDSRVDIESLRSESKVKNTAKLLDKVYNGTTALGKFEAKALRKKIVKIISDLMEDIDLLKRETYKPEIEKIERVINHKLNKEEAFFGFKLTLVNKKTPDIIDK